MKCETKGHKFQKFDDESLFCKRCGDRRVIASKAWWGVIPPTTWHPRPYWWEPNWYTITSGSTTSIADGVIDINSTFSAYPEGTSVTYTASDGSHANA